MHKSKHHNEAVITKYGLLEEKKFIAVMDLEMTCWDDQDPNKKPRSAMEIIEIGIEVVDLNYNRVSSHSFTIKPVYNPILTAYCTNLTGITQEEVNASRNLSVTMPEVLSELPNTKDFIWACWGNDAVWLQTEITAKAYHMEKRSYGMFEFDPRFINVKLCYGKRGGLKKALDALNLEQHYPAHRALADAISTTKVLKALNLSPLDSQISNEKTYRQAILHDRNQMVDKLTKRLNKEVDRDFVERVLKTVKWDYTTALNVFKLFDT